MHEGAGLAPRLWYQAISGEILTHLKKQNIFLAKKLTMLERFFKLRKQLNNLEFHKQTDRQTDRQTDT